MKKLKQRKGITLIALVLTIIVLLILAGITINLTIGQDGILKRAEEAGRNYTEAAEKEKTELAQFSNLTDKIIENVTKNHYTMVEGVPVPKGFSHKEGTKDTGFVIKNDADGNEFVWVPCTIDGANGSIKYDRYAFSRDGWDYSQTFHANTGEVIFYEAMEKVSFTEERLSEEEKSVKEYSGFYIGRYESGVMGHDISVNKTPSGTNEWTGYSNGKLVIQSGKQVWNYITRDMAKSISQGLYSKVVGDSVNSKLCSSYAWDTALKFIDTKNSGYSTDSTIGNYADKADSLGKPAKTGETTAVNNIYDMGGNTWEWTTEKCDYKVSEEIRNCTIRGGDFGGNSNKYPAAYRGCNTNVYAGLYTGFRVALYL